MILRVFSVFLILDLSLGLVCCSSVGTPRDNLLKTITISAQVSLAAFSPNGETLAIVDKTKPSSVYIPNL